MLHQLLIVVILYIIINQVILSFSEEKKIKPSEKPNSNNPLIDQSSHSDVAEVIPLDLFGKPFQVEPNKFILWTFLEPKPWTQIIYNYGHEYPFNFFLKIKIPSLNDYQTWKQIIPNLDFNSKTGELIIPSKDEGSALAIVNLIVSNFQGQLSIENILEKNLIQISIAKAQQYDMVRNKLREQIIETVQGKNIIDKTDFEQDLASNQTKTNESFGNNEPGAYEGGEFSY